MLLHHIGYAVCDDSRLTGSCACKDEQGAVKMRYCLPLFIVKPFKPDRIMKTVTTILGNP